MTRTNINPFTMSDEQRLEAMIPEPRYAEIYTHRHITSSVNGAKYFDFDLLDEAMANKHNVMLPGPTGSGKTTFGRAYAAHLGVPYASIEFSGSFNYTEAVGSVTGDEKGNARFVMGKMALVIGERSVLNCAEVSLAHPKATAAIHGITDARQELYISQTGQSILKHPECLIIADYNPGYSGTSTLNEAFLNRFAYTIQWGYDAGVEDIRIGTQTKTLLDMVRNMRSLEEMDDIDISTNMMEEFVMIARGSGIGLAAQIFLNKFDTDLQASVSDALNANLWDIASDLGVDADR